MNQSDHKELSAGLKRGKTPVCKFHLVLALIYWLRKWGFINVINCIHLTPTIKPLYSERCHQMILKKAIHSQSLEFE